MAETQRDLDGHAVFDHEELEAVIRKVVREERDRYAGDAVWLERRVHMHLIADVRIAVGFQEVQEDLWCQENFPMEPVQWDRARRRFARNVPKGTWEASDFFAFFVEGKGRGKWYIARTNEVHCAISAGVSRQHMKDLRRAGQITRRLRERYGGVDETVCERCKRDATKIAE